MLSQLQALFEAEKVPYSRRPHRAAFTAQEAAEAEHVPGKQFAKVVIAKAGEGFCMAVLPATKHLSLDKLGKLLPGKAVRLAAEQEFTGLFPQCEPGAMPPFGNLFGLAVFVDRSLEEDEEISFLAGSHAESIHMRYRDFRRLAAPTVADIAA
jgi:Ala-tRNA(Pro) deacylase